MKAALDTNILVYAEGLNGSERQEAANRMIVDASRDHDVVVSAQALKELLNVLLRKSGRPPDEARAAVKRTAATFHVTAVTSDTVLAAAELVERHSLNLWDAIVLAAAAEADCDILLSEDLQPGFIWRRCRVVNPFA